MDKTSCPTAVYIHVPFCSSHCTYCDFYSTISTADDHLAWHEGIVKEIGLLASYADKQPLRSIYFGGGTPSLVDATLPAWQVDHLAGLFGLEDKAEITLEANPESVSKAKAIGWHAAGINRVSIGLQSADPSVLRTLGRRHTAADFEAAVYCLREVGFKNISADLMVGIPGQSMDTLDRTLDLVDALNLDHLSFYSLSLEADTPLYERYAHCFPSLEEEDRERTMYWHVRQRLAESGFHVYEISNAAKDGFKAVHNLVYWRAEPYFGLGPAAASYVDAIRRQHPASIRAWLANLDACQPTQASYTRAQAVETIDAMEARKEYMMLGLRLTDGIDLISYSTRFGDNPEETFAAELLSLKDKGLVEKKGRHIALSRLGIDLANLAFSCFV